MSRCDKSLLFPGEAGVTYTGSPTLGSPFLASMRTAPNMPLYSHTQVTLLTLGNYDVLQISFYYRLFLWYFLFKVFSPVYLNVMGAMDGIEMDS